MSRGAIRVEHWYSSRTRTGTYRFLRELVPALNATGVVSASVVSLLDGPLHDEARELGIHVVGLRATGGNPAADVWAARGHLRRRPAAILHVHGYRPAIAAYLGKRLAGARDPLVATVHGSPEPGSGVASVRMRLYAWGERMVRGRGCRWVTAVSPTLAAELQTSGIPGGRVCVVRNWIDPRRLRELPARSEVRRELGLDPEGLVIGTVSRLHLVKRVDLLIRAFGLVRASHSEARLVVVGDGPEAPRLRELAQREGVGQAVSFLGAREDALRLLAGFDIYALCSAHEGGPFALLEAMAVGCAVVATPVGLAPEMLEQASAGILLREATPAALAGALEGLASSRAVRDRMGAAGREFVATHLSLGRAVGEYVQLYRSVAEEHPCVVGGG